MATHKPQTGGRGAETERPRIEIIPRAAVQGDMIIVRGAGWQKRSASLSLDGKPLRGAAVIQGTLEDDRVAPDATGAFMVRIERPLLAPGRHVLGAVPTPADKASAVRVAFHLAARVTPTPGVKGGDKPFWRAHDYFIRRFGAIGFVPPGLATAQAASLEQARRHRDELREKFLETKVGDLRKLYYGGAGGEFFDDGGFEIVEAKCRHRLSFSRWTPLGPAVVPRGQTEGSPTQPVSGRVLSIAIAPVTDAGADRTILAGTASGGIWKSTDSGRTWRPTSDDHVSVSVGTIAIDPNDPSRVFAGTGEHAHFAGWGLLASTNGGDSWTRIETDPDFARNHEVITRIAFDPTDPESKRMFLSSSSGWYESMDRGQHWTKRANGFITDFVLIATPGSPATLKVIVAPWGGGLSMNLRTESAGGLTWQYGLAIQVPADFPAESLRTALAQCAARPDVIYAAFGFRRTGIRIMKTDNGGTSWTIVSPPLKASITGATDGAVRPGSDETHYHGLALSEADLTPPFAPTKEFTTGEGRTLNDVVDPHTHTVVLSSGQLETLSKGDPIAHETRRTDADHWHTISLVRSIGGQNTYNLVLAVDPTRPEIVYYGEQRLWKTTTGDGPWTHITDGEPAAPVTDRPIGTHVDQHALTFDPLVEDTLWIGNDGGVYVSPDGGQTWSHANRDLATLQYNQISSHPLWDAVLIGGTQDNGTHRYLGHPAWTFVDGGDGGFTALDALPAGETPPRPPRVYHGYYGVGCARSDAAGDPGTWQYLSGPQPPSLFYPPFRVDTGDTKVCYFGGLLLFRSNDFGGTGSWTAISKDDDFDQGLVSAIAVAGRRRVFVGTHHGRVYRVERTGPTWSRADGDVTVTRLAGGADFSGRYVSDLAVDAEGVVWVTVLALPPAEANGEFKNHDYVYRSVDPEGDDDWTWESRSNGLPVAHAIHSFAIDPSDEFQRTLFCGGERAVFRSDDRGECWLAWDNGLPNAPVMHLDVHNRTRLLRAATYGRSVWERPIDPWLTRDVELYVRDSVLDTGRVRPSPSEVNHPFYPETSVYWWESPDIKVDVASPDFQTPGVVNEYIGFEALQDGSTRGTARHRVYVQVHNRGPRTAHKVSVRVFASRVQYEDLPANFWSDPHPFGGDPQNEHWRPVGPTREIAELQPAEPGIVEWDWDLGNELAGQYALLALVTSDEDPLSGTSERDVSILAPGNRHVAVKNVQLAGGSTGIDKPSIFYQVYLPERLFFIIPRDFRIDWGNLPRGTRIDVAFERVREGSGLEGTKKDLRALGIAARAKRPAAFAASLKGRLRGGRAFDAATYQVTRGRERITTLPGVKVPTNRPFGVALQIELPKTAATASRARRDGYRFSVTHEGAKGGRQGLTCLIRPEAGRKKG